MAGKIVYSFFILGDGKIIFSWEEFYLWNLPVLYSRIFKSFYLLRNK